MLRAPPPADGAPGTRFAWDEVAGWFLLFALLAVLWTWPLPLHLHDQFLSPVGDPPLLARADAHLTTWVLAWGSHALRTAPLDLFDTNAFYPLPKTLAFSEHLLAAVLVLLPVDVVFGPHAVRNHNLLLLLSYAGAGAGTALLTRALGAGPLPAFLGGVMFAFHSGRFASVMHVQTLSVHWMPLTLLFLHRLLRTGRWQAGLAFTLCLLLALLSGVYWFYYLGIAVGLAILADAACGCPAARRARLKALGCAALALALTLPVMLQYALARELYALGRSSGEAWFFSGKLITYLGPLLDPADWWARRFDAGVHPYLLGPAAIALVATALAGGAPPAAGGRRRATMYGVVLLGMILISLGPVMQARSLLDAGLPGPHLLLERLVPGYSALRTPGRAAHVAMLPAAVLVALGAEWLRRRVRSSLSRRWLVLLILAAALSEVWRPPLHLERAASGAVPPPAYEFLRTRPDRGAVIEIPVGALEDARAMALSTWHWRPLVNGYSGFTPTGSWLRATTFWFPHPPVLRTLWEIGVRWIVVRPAELAPARQRLCLDPPPGSTGTWMVRRFADGDLCVFELAAEPPPHPALPDRPLPLTGAKVTTSSGDAAPMLDGDLATHWVEDVTPLLPGFVQIELPEPRPLTRVVFRLGPHLGEFTRHVRVEVSEDGGGFRQVGDHVALPPPFGALRHAPDAAASTVPLPGTPVRTVRIIRPAQDATTAMDLFLNWKRWGIHELELYEAAGPPPGG